MLSFQIFESFVSVIASGDDRKAQGAEAYIANSMKPLLVDELRECIDPTGV